MSGALTRLPRLSRIADMPRVARAMSILALLLGGARSAVAEPPLQALAAATVGTGQGVYAVAGDGSVLVAQAEARAVHPASVSKVATSLALLERLGPAYRFSTTLRAGPIHDGRLQGNLVVDAGGDPFLVDEGALMLVQRLHGRGVRDVDGRVVVRGRLLFDWQPDPDGRRLQAALSGSASGEAWAKVVARVGGPPHLRDAALVFHGRAVPADVAETIVVYRSPPLLHLVKVLNGYSNNVFQFVADAVGGAAAVEEGTRRHVPASMREEIVIANGAGAGAANRLSPRAAVALLDALDAELARGGRDLTAALPVSGIDPGTLAHRLDDQRGIVVGKTGTFGSYGASALIGALRTRRYGVVRFAVLNHDVPVPDARARQDAFVRALASATEAQPWPYAVATDPDYGQAALE